MAASDQPFGEMGATLWLWKVPVVLTVDTQAAWDSNNKWVKENCLEVTFAEPCYTV